MEISKKYKYQYLLEEFNIVDSCPCGELTEDERDSYRWSLSPIDSHLNFLPNVLYNKLKPQTRPRRVNDSQDLTRLCGECGISLFTTLKQAKDFHLSLGKPARQGLGYTHVASGRIVKESGVRTSISKNGHFNFYEYEGVDFKATFSIVDVLVIEDGKD